MGKRSIVNNRFEKKQPETAGKPDTGGSEAGDIQGSVSGGNSGHGWQNPATRSFKELKQSGYFRCF